jgi:hypothetical protein
MAEKTFYWKAQLNVGQRGEDLFAEMYPKVTKTDGRVSDFVLNGEGIELKTDTYSMDATPNFFMEYYGNVDKAAIGGPWRAAKDGVTWFVYMFIQQKKCFWFRSETLVKFLNEHIKTLKPKSVKNRGYEALGYAVSREACAHLQEEPK